MYQPVLVTPPRITPVSLVEAKAHCKADDFTDDDVLLGALIDAAVGHVDGWTGTLGRCLCEQTWRQDYDVFERTLRLPLFPVISVASVKYRDAAGVEHTVDSANYRLLSDGQGYYVKFIYSFNSPAVDREAPAVNVTYVAGYADVATSPQVEPPTYSAGNVPAPLKQAMLLRIGHWYENREAVLVGTHAAALPLPMAADALDAPYRRCRF